jgi:UDP-glucose 4-epimerase
VHALVVGGAGFLGSHLVDRLLAEGHVVDVVDDLSTGSLGNLSAARSTAAGALKFHHLDARADELDDLVGRREPEIVYHLAALPAGAPDRRVAEAGVGGTLNVLEIAARNGLAKVVVALPANELYGAVATKELPVREAQPWAPTTVRGVAARAIADLLAIYRSQRSVEYTALALTNVYGSRQRPADGVVASFATCIEAGELPQMHGDGRQARDFLFVDDAVDALVRAGTKGSGLVINVGTGTQTTIREIYDLLAGPGASAPKSGTRRAEEIGRFAVSPVRARIHLAWAPWTPIAEGLATLRR